MGLYIVKTVDNSRTDLIERFNSMEFPSDGDIMVKRHLSHFLLEPKNAISVFKMRFTARIFSRPDTAQPGLSTLSV